GRRRRRAHRAAAAPEHGVLHDSPRRRPQRLDHDGDHAMNHELDTLRVPLYRLAHGRSGDKGDISNLSVIAWDPECYAVLAEQVTEARVAAWFAYRSPTRVTRYLIPSLHAMNFVLEGVLD